MDWDHAGETMVEFITSPVIIIGWIVLCLIVLPVLFALGRTSRSSGGIRASNTSSTNHAGRQRKQS